MSIKKPLLEIVQEILSDMDSEEVNTIGDTTESQQVASIVERTFYNIIATRDIPDEERLVSLHQSSDDTAPTSMTLPENIKKIGCLQYNVQTYEDPLYRDVIFVEPRKFLDLTNNPQTNYIVVLEKVTGQPLRIRTDAHPKYWTTFDDENVIFDSYNSSVEDTLQEGKIRALGSVFPLFDIADDYVPDIAPQYFPYLINEAKSVAFDVLKGGTTAKVDQAARRQKAYIQNDKYRVKRNRRWSCYGRR